MRLGLPQSLFGRTALLVAITLCVFSLIVWQAVMWAVVVPTADLTAEILADRAREAIAAQHRGASLPDGATLSALEPRDVTPQFRGLAYGVYLRRLRSELSSRLNASQIVVAHARAPAQVGIRSAETGGQWLVLSIRLARAQAPLAVIAVFSSTALLVLGVSAWSARRLTTPLARLAVAAVRIAEGEVAEPSIPSGPSEVRSLAMAFQSMSHRLTELNEERELMLAGISHDLRSPLARIRIAVELLDVRDESLAQQMNAEIEEMDRMIGTFLHYVRAGYRETPIRAIPDSIVREALAPLANDSRLQIQLGAPDHRILNAEAVRHIALNLVQNALEHGKPPVRVVTSALPDSVYLSVQDAGPGISAHDWQEGLRPFSRLRAAPGAGHAGLGLALVDRLVRAARGSLEARQAEDGFHVSVVLPAAAEVNSRSSGPVSQ